MASYGATAAWGPVVTAAAPAVPAAGSPAPIVRLTRRGRLVRTMALGVLLVALVVAGAARLTGQPARAGDVPTRPVATQSVVVEQGDSLWLIAQRAAPESDPRELVREIRELNGLRSNLIQPGQVLLVPGPR